MIPVLLLAAGKFAIGGGLGVLVGYVVGLAMSKGYFEYALGITSHPVDMPYKYAALWGYAAGFAVNFGVNYLLGNLSVHP